MTTMRIVESEEEGEEFFASAIGHRCEGIMAKSVADDSVYRAGSRGFLWIKYKKDYQQALTDSFDLAVVGASETALNIYLLKKLKRFHMEYPGIRIKIYNHSTPQAVQSVKSGEIDFAVVTTPTTACEPLKEIKLQSFREILVGCETFTALGSQELSLGEVLNYPFICLGRETMTYQFYYQFFMAHGLEMKLDTEAATTDQILPLVKSELGLAFIPEPMAQQSIKMHEIVRICLNEEIPERNICMVYDAKRPMSMAAKRLKKILLEEKDNEIFSD